MRHGSLFSGIGGFDLAAEWMGWENVFHCEWNPFGQKVLKHYWPNAKSYTDITKTDFSIHRGEIDIITGGFPCQPFSGAGKRKGKEDNRYLWPEMFRAIKEIQPTWVVAENVYGIINQGGGVVFEQVQVEMENEGYQVQSYILPACAKDAPHRRDRFWFVAYNSSIRCLDTKSKINTVERQQAFNEVAPSSRITSNTNGIGNYNDNRTEGGNNESEQSEDKEQKRNGWASETERYGTDGYVTDTELRGCEKRWRQSISRINYNYFQIGRAQVEPTLCRGDDGLSNWVDRIKGLGNAVVPQVAFEIFKAIEQFESL